MVTVTLYYRMPILGFSMFNLSETIGHLIGNIASSKMPSSKYRTGSIS